MDACTYESITGLKNYYGFKSLLKNGAWTQRYSCDDDTIVFNRIENFTFQGGGFSLLPNQVGIVLNMTTGIIDVLVSQYVYEGITARDVDNQIIILFGNQAIVGMVLTNTFSFYLSNTPYKSITLAIFDLY